MPFVDLHQLEEIYSRHGIDTVYVKHLAAKQDNEKNQIYLGSSLDGAQNLFPARTEARSHSESVRKRASDKGKPKIEAQIDLAWLTPDGTFCPATNARIIDYFQYPEVRLSGFLKGCRNPPDALRRRKQAQYGQRILLLGVRPDSKVMGVVLTERDDPIVLSFPDLPELPASPALRVLVFGGKVGRTPRDLLAEELAGIVAGEWHDSVILKPSNADSIPFSGSQGGGYTLEALMGVSANAGKRPDKYGFEIKSFSGSRISLMTPTPDQGYQGDHTFREFMEKYGRPGDKGDGSLRFTGLHKVGETNARTGLILEVRGYDPAADKFSGDASSVAVTLADPATGAVAARWSLEHLANAWNAKHASAVYVRCDKGTDRDTGRPQYRYNSKVFIGEGTDIWRLLRAIARGLVFYDPADSIYADGKAKVRPQWRLNSAQLLDVMKVLYMRASEVTLAQVSQGTPRSPRQLSLL